MNFIGASGIWTLVGVVIVVCLVLWIAIKKVK